MKCAARVFVGLSCVAAAGALSAASIMPSFADIPTGWVTDRYEPTSFANVGTYMGRDNVLGIGITSAGDLANRLPGYQSTFYNTQGRQHALTGVAGDVLSADLYVPASWADGAAGSVRTDMWGVMTDGSVVTEYPILGFSNYGGAARFRLWDQDVPSLWVDLGASINYDAWNSFAITFTGTVYEYSVNGTLVYTDTTINSSTTISAVIMQAYNFADPSITGATPVNYTAHWSNTPVPELTSTLALLGLGLGTLGGLRRRLA